jgi:hypothetical protein
MGIRGLFIGTRADKDAPKRPSRVWEITHPRKAEALWAAEEQEAEMQIEEAERQEAERDTADDRWAAYAVECDLGRHQGNPPDSRLLDMQIGHYAGQYPEITDAERAQAEYRAELDERGLDREGPGYTEPPLDWEGWHEDHPGWTFTEWAEARGWDAEYVAEINAAFPPDEAEAKYGRDRDERERQPYTWHGVDRDGDAKSGETIMRDKTVPAMVRGFWNADYRQLEVTRDGTGAVGGITPAKGFSGAMPWHDVPEHGGPEPGTNEWYYARGHSDEPDWSKDPAVDDRHGLLYYGDGNVTQFDGTVVHEAPKEAGQ